MRQGTGHRLQICRRLASEPASYLQRDHLDVRSRNPQDVGCLLSDAVYAHPVSASFYDVGTPSDYLATSLAIAEADGLTSLPLGKGSTVDVSASVIRTAIWDDVIIESGCRVSDCVIADGVRLPKNTHCERQVITVSGNHSLPFGRHLGNLWLSPLDL